MVIVWNILWCTSVHVFAYSSSDSVGPSAAAVQGLITVRSGDVSQRFRHYSLGSILIDR